MLCGLDRREWRREGISGKEKETGGILSFFFFFTKNKKNVAMVKKKNTRMPPIQWKFLKTKQKKSG
jgi:hypothetical protein